MIFLNSDTEFRWFFKIIYDFTFSKHEIAIKFIEYYFLINFQLECSDNVSTIYLVTLFMRVVIFYHKYETEIIMYCDAKNALIYTCYF